MRINLIRITGIGVLLLLSSTGLADQKEAPCYGNIKRVSCFVAPLHKTHGTAISLAVLQTPIEVALPFQPPADLLATARREQYVCGIIARVEARCRSDTSFT